MDFVVLGCGSAFPCPKRGASAYVLRLSNGECWMFDCGEGTQIELMKSEVRPGRIRRIFITHLHGDHVFGLPGLMCTMGQLGSVSEESGLHIVDIYGPRGLRRFLRETLRLSRSVLPYKYRVHEMHFDSDTCRTTAPFTGDKNQLEAVMWDPQAELTEASDSPHPGEIAGEDLWPNMDGLWRLHSPSSKPTASSCSVWAAWLPHTAPSFAFLVQESDKAGKLDKERAVALGVKPGPDLGLLKSGKEVITADGRTVRSEDVLGSPIPGKRVAILGDTSDSTAALKSLCGESDRRLDLLVHEATLRDEKVDSALAKGHSTPSQAGASANLCKSECLLLTHFSQRYDDMEIEALKEEAAQQFKGKIELARPLMKLRV